MNIVIASTNHGLFEGLTHDDEYWYMSNQHVLYKTTVDPITIVLANYRAIPVSICSH